MYLATAAGAPVGRAIAEQLPAPGRLDVPRRAVASSDALQWAVDLPGQLDAGGTVRGPYADAAVSPVHPAALA